MAIYFHEKNIKKAVPDGRTAFPLIEILAILNRLLFYPRNRFWVFQRIRPILQ
jgi:hypothetical protein